jgi:hypothetical protein
MKAVEYATEKCKLGEYEIVFQRIALRHPAGGCRTGFSLATERACPTAPMWL